MGYAGFALFLSSDDNLGTWGMIVPYLIIYGIGRGTWENTNKAVVADLYTETPDLSTSAFASIAFFNGLAGMSIYMNMTHTICVCSFSWSLINSLIFAVTFFKTDCDPNPFATISLIFPLFICCTVIFSTDLFFFQ